MISNCIDRLHLIYSIIIIIIILFCIFIFSLTQTGVIANSNGNGNNGSLATPIENRTSFTNNSHYNGTINELIVSETIPNNDGSDAEHMVDVESSLSSLSLMRINNNSSSVSASLDGALSKENGVQMPTTTTTHTETTTAKAATIQPPTTPPTIINATSVLTTIAPLSTIAKMVTIHTTIAPLNGDGGGGGGHITNHMQTSQFIASSNTRRDNSSTATPSTLPITTNKPRK